MTNTIQLSSRLQARLAIISEQLVNFCQRWEVAELMLFVSILRDYFHPDSDNVLIPKRKMMHE
jgi:uncharacterized protein